MIWCDKVRLLAPDSKFFEPNDKHSPMIGWYCVASPRGETGISHEDMEQAALWFLAAVLNNEDARAALRRQPR